MGMGGDGVIESYCCGEEGQISGEERIWIIRRTRNSQEEVCKESDKVHEEKKHVEECRTAVERRTTFLVKNAFG